MWFFRKKQEKELKSQEYEELDNKITLLKRAIFHLETDVSLIENRLKRTSKLKKEDTEAKDFYKGMLLPDDGTI